jgi:TPR repeat protein
MNIFRFKVTIFLGLCMFVGSSWGATLELDTTKLPALETSAKQGDPDAQTTLSRIYLFGPKEMRNEEKALYWLRQAVQKNYGPAEYLFGMILVSNKNDKSKIQEGGWYLSQSAAHGCAGAAGLLGNILFAASSRNPDAEPKAVMYIRQAAEGGDYMSQILLAKVYSTGGRTIRKDFVTAYAWLEFARTDRPNHRFSNFSNDLHARLKAKLDKDELGRANELAGRLKEKYGRTTYEFCSQSLPDEVQAEGIRK